ncbi:MAG: PKD domain-containing protein, partial [Planctomycetes bacterium]|nr:PKD domain-containing protein [Planctomycetota bacterium]
KLLADDGAEFDQFGIRVAISGVTAIVGSIFDDDNGTGSGSAYLFDTTTGQQIVKLLADDGAEDDHFGISVAISGDTAIVGTWLDDDNGDASGSAYLFDTTTGQQIAKLLADDGAEGDWFGFSVTIDGATAIVGALLDDDNGIDSGSAYVFDSATGQQLAKLLPDDGAASDIFGGSVAISGATAIVGAHLDDANGDESGSAYVFDLACSTDCEGDANGDGVVDPLDTGFVLARFGCPVGTGDSGCDTADMNGDGLVDPLDVGYILARFGPCP